MTSRSLERSSKRPLGLTLLHSVQQLQEVDHPSTFPMLRSLLTRKEASLAQLRLMMLDVATTLSKNKKPIGEIPTISLPLWPDDHYDQPARGGIPSDQTFLSMTK